MERPDWLPPVPDGWRDWAEAWAGIIISNRADGSASVFYQSTTAGAFIVASRIDEEMDGASCRLPAAGANGLRAATAAIGLTEWLPTTPDGPGLWRYSDGIQEGAAVVALKDSELVAMFPGVQGAQSVAECDVEWRGPIY